MKRPLWQVDAFAGRPFAGNCTVLGGWCVTVIEGLFRL